MTDYWCCYFKPHLQKKPPWGGRFIFLEIKWYTLSFDSPYHQKKKLLKENYFQNEVVTVTYSCILKMAFLQIKLLHFKKNISFFSTIVCSVSRVLFHFLFFCRARFLALFLARSLCVGLAMLLFFFVTLILLIWQLIGHYVYIYIYICKCT